VLMSTPGPMAPSVGPLGLPGKPKGEPGLFICACATEVSKAASDSKGLKKQHQKEAVNRSYVVQRVSSVGGAHT
jgi:hypothetical protein